MGGNGSHSSGSGTGRDFPPVFSWDWDGKRFIFVGVGRERFENSLPCHLLVHSTLDGRCIKREDRLGGLRWLRQTWEAIWEALVAPLQDVSCTPGYLRFMYCEPRTAKNDVSVGLLQNQKLNVLLV